MEDAIALTHTHTHAHATGNDCEGLIVDLEPGSIRQQDEYILMRRMLLRKQTLQGKLRRQTWQCNGVGYNVYRKYICDLKENIDLQSRISGEWTPHSEPLTKVPSSTFNQQPSVGFESEKKQQEPAYAFVGMKCIFDSCKSSVSIVKFGHLTSDLLAFGAADGTICICSCLKGNILHRLKVHTKEITDLDWSLNNHYICSSSLDKNVCVWDASEGHCVRVVYDKTPQLCVRFRPVNNNHIVAGTGDGHLKVINFSTGRHLHTLGLKDQITAIDMDPSGRVLFAGDSEGYIYSIAVDSHSGKLTYEHKNNMGLKRKSITTTVQFRVFSLLAGGPVLLTSNQDGTLRFFSVALQVNGYLTLRCCLYLSPHARNIRASFCPLLSLEKGEFIVSGSEDKNVYFYDFTRPKHPCVNKLQGHGAPVTSVSWNHGENLLASSDCEGLVIIWERAK